jgi:hypothetical protein
MTLILTSTFPTITELKEMDALQHTGQATSFSERSDEKHKKKIILLKFLSEL